MISKNYFKLFIITSIIFGARIYQNNEHCMNKESKSLSILNADNTGKYENQNIKERDNYNNKEAFNGIAYKIYNDIKTQFE